MENLATQPDFDFSAYNTMGLSSDLAHVSLISNPKTLLKALKTLPHAHVAGELSNTLVGPKVTQPIILFRDGDILSIEENGSNVLVRLEGSCALDKLTEILVGKDIAGFELLSGIPGTVGAGLVQNVGAYGAEISTYFHSARAWDLTRQEERILTAEDFDFKYRASQFKGKEKGILVLEATFSIPLNNPASALTYADLEKQHKEHQRDMHNIAHIRQTVIDVRSTKGMVVNYEGWAPCVGSYFVSPAAEEAIAKRIAEKVRGKNFADQFLKWYRPDANQVRVPAALVLRAAGFLNGDTWQNVALSERHVLALTAKTGATGNDVASLAAYIKETAKQKLGITLNQEILHLGEFHIQASEEFLASHPYIQGASEPSWVKD